MAAYSNLRCRGTLFPQKLMRKQEKMLTLDRSASCCDTRRSLRGIHSTHPSPHQTTSALAHTYMRRATSSPKTPASLTTSTPSAPTQRATRPPAPSHQRGTRTTSSASPKLPRTPTRPPAISSLSVREGGFARECTSLRGPCSSPSAGYCGRLTSRRFLERSRIRTLSVRGWLVCRRNMFVISLRERERRSRLWGAGRRRRGLWMGRDSGWSCQSRWRGAHRCVLRSEDALIFPLHEPVVLSSSVVRDEGRFIVEEV